MYACTPQSNLSHIAMSVWVQAGTKALAVLTYAALLIVTKRWQSAHSTMTNPHKRPLNAATRLWVNMSTQLIIELIAVYVNVAVTSVRRSLHRSGSAAMTQRWHQHDKSESWWANIVLLLVGLDIDGRFFAASALLSSAVTFTLSCRR